MTDQMLERVETPVTSKTRMTAAEYAQLDLPETSYITELIDGEIFVVSSPKFAHQSASAHAFSFVNDLKRSGQITGEVCFATLDVYMDEYNVVQPDVFWVSADNTRCALGEDGYWHGAPDLIVEVLSPSTARRDRIEKFSLYEKHGVREYWIVESSLPSVEVWVLTDGLFQLQGTYSPVDDLNLFTSPVLGGITVDLKAVFA